MTATQVLAVKRAVRARDGMVCVECGRTNADHIAEFGRTLDVHRVTPGSEYSVEPGVCVTLCRNCHSTKPKRPSGSVQRAYKSVRLPARLWEAIEELAAERFTRPGVIVVQSILDYLSQHGVTVRPAAK